MSVDAAAAAELLPSRSHARLTAYAAALQGSAEILIENEKIEQGKAKTKATTKQINNK